MCVFDEIHRLKNRASEEHLLVGVDCEEQWEMCDFDDSPIGFDEGSEWKDESQGCQKPCKDVAGSWITR